MITCLSCFFKKKITTKFEPSQISDIQMSIPEDKPSPHPPQFKRLHQLCDLKSNLYLVQNNDTGSFAVEKVCSMKSSKKMWREWNIMKNLNVSEITGIIKVYDCNIDKINENAAKSFFMEYANGGDLLDFIDSTENYYKDEMKLYPSTHFVKKYYKKLLQVLDFAEQLSYTLKELHNIDLIHFDIKPENILIKKIKTDKIKLLLTDFEFCEIIQIGQQDLFSTIKGTQNYVDPELMNSTKDCPVSGKATDVYSLGITLWCCAFHTYPYYTPEYPWNKHNLPFDYWQLRQDLLLNLLLEMIAIPQANRPNMNEVHETILKLREYYKSSIPIY